MAAAVDKPFTRTFGVPDLSRITRVEVVPADSMVIEIVAKYAVAFTTVVVPLDDSRFAE